MRVSTLFIIPLIQSLIDISEANPATKHDIDIDIHTTRMTASNCTNSQTFSFGSYEFNGEIVYRTCEWIIANPIQEIIDKRRSMWCDTFAFDGGAEAPVVISDANSVQVKEKCPLSCSVCEVDNGGGNGGGGGGDSGSTFDLNDCSSYDNLWQSEIDDSCSANITSPNCKCTDAESKIASGVIHCPTAQCPLDCSVCDLCLSYLTNCLFQTSPPTPQPSLTVQPSISVAPSVQPSSYVVSTAAPTASPTISCTGRVLVVGGDDSSVLAYGSIGTNGGEGDVIKIDIQYDLEISDVYPMVITDEGHENINSTSSTVETTQRSSLMGLNETTLEIVLTEITEIMSSSILGNLFPECTSVERVRTRTMRRIRRLSNNTDGDGSGIDIVGMTATVGEVLPQISCSSGNEDQSSSYTTCIVIGSTTTMYLNDNNASAADVNNLKQSASTLIVSEMSNLSGDLYSVKGVKAVGGSTENDDIVDNEPPTAAPTPTPTPTMDGSALSGLAIGFIAMGSGIGVLLCGFICHCRRRKNRHGHGKEEQADEDLKNQFVIDNDIDDSGSFPIKGSLGSVGGNGKLGSQSVDIDYSFDDNDTKKDKEDDKNTTSDEEAMIKEDTDKNSPSTSPVVEDEDSAEKKLFAMDVFKNRLSVARSMFVDDNGTRSDGSTISSKDVRSQTMNPNGQYFSADSFKHRMTITRNTIDSPVRSAVTYSRVTESPARSAFSRAIDSPARSARSRITNPVSEGTYDSRDPLVDFTTSNERLKSVRTLILGGTDPTMKTNEPKETEVTQVLLKTNDTDSSTESDERISAEKGEDSSNEKTHDGDETSKPASVVNDAEIDSHDGANIETQKEGLIEGQAVPYDEDADEVTSD